jgi:hypothetical protein
MRRHARLPLTLAASALLAATACDKSSRDTTTPVDPQPVPQDQSDTCDPRLSSVIDGLEASDRDAVLTHTDGELATDLSDVAFDDLSRIVKTLGPLQSCRATSETTYDLDFEQGTLEARITLEGDRLHGLYFAGEAFESAQHKVLGDADLLFKVYDFYPSETDGTPLDPAAAFEPGRQHFTLIVGGFQATEGEHHVTLRKTVTDANGKVVFDSPEEMDITFARNLEGVRTAKILKYVDLEEPGTYQVKLQLKDEVSRVELEHQSSFEIAKP